MTGIEKALVVLRALGSQADRVMAQLDASVAAKVTDMMGRDPIIPKLDEQLVAELTMGVSALASDTDDSDDTDDSEVADTVDPQVTKLIELFQDEDPQMVAFALQKVPEPLRQPVLDGLPYTTREMVDGVAIASVPISEDVLATLELNV